MNIEIYPLDKVLIDGVSICLGREREDVEGAIGKVQPAGRRYYYYNSEMAIDYNDDKKIEFIEFLGGVDGALRPCVYGFSVFDTPADELAELLKQKNNGEITDSEQGYSLSFANIGVGVYRERTASDVTAMLEEMKTDGIPTDDNEDIEAEKRKANCWATIGIGAAGYYPR